MKATVKKHGTGAAAKAPREANGAAPLAVEGELVAAGSQADAEAFLGEARAIAAADIVPMRADLQLAVHNLKIGVASVLAESKRLERLPETTVAHFAALPALALAVVFTGTQIDRAPKASEVAPLLEKAGKARGLLMKVAVGLAAAGALRRADVEKILAGKGKLDMARDCVALAALFTNNAASLKGKHPVTAAQIKEAAEVGTKLLGLLKPGRAKPTRVAPNEAAVDRDRLWTLLLRRYDALWRAGAYLFGRDAVDAKVPALQASRGAGKKKNGAEKPAPAPTP